MQGKTRLENYKHFLAFVTAESQKERRDVGRRMFSVFLWCLILPVVTLLVFLVLLRFQILPRAARGYLEWIILIFPVCYSIYVLISEVLKQLPAAIRQGGAAATLQEAVKESVWRERICEGMGKMDFDPETWNWILASYRIDLAKFKYRTGYLTVFATAIFYFLIEGVDIFGESEQKMTWVKSPMGWIDTSGSDFSQYIGLAIFLALFYLSGSQSYHNLKRYLDSAELMLLQKRHRGKPADGQ